MFKKFYENKRATKEVADVETEQAVEYPKAQLEDIAADTQLYDDMGQFLMTYLSSDMEVDAAIRRRVLVALSLDPEEAGVVDKVKSLHQAVTEHMKAEAELDKAA